MQRERRFIIPIFIPHEGCPHRCVYCDQSRITGTPKMPEEGEIVEIIRQHLRTKGPGCGKTQVAFYGGSFTALQREVRGRLLEATMPLLENGEVDSLRLSTRPDSIDPTILAELHEWGVETVELGVQSMDEDVLRISRRGYGPEVVRDAVMLLHEGGFEIGIQLMVGLPGETPEGLFLTVDEVIRLRPHFVRIYPTLVIRGTVLERWLERGEYRPLRLEEAVELAKEMVVRFEEAGIAVIRIGLQPTSSLEKSIIAGPYHPAFGQLVRSALLLEKARELLRGHKGEEVTFRVSPGDLSSFFGQRKENLRKLKEDFALRLIKVIPDPSIERGGLRLAAA